MNFLVAALPALGVLALMFGMGVGMAYLNKKKKYEQDKETITSFETVVSDLQKALKEQFDMMLNLAQKRPTMTGTMPAGDTVRVYAVLLARGLETRLVAVPAQAFEDMIELVTKEYGIGWAVAASCYLDMEVVKKVGKEEKPVPAKAEKAEEAPKADPGKFVTTLLYCKDTFAETPFEKRSLTSVINRIKKRYALDTTAA